MKMDFDAGSKQGFYDEETRQAIQWLYNIWDTDKKGWAWVQFIHPNEQNTAEVVATFIDYIDQLDEKQIDCIVESANCWLLDTDKPRISIDFCWVVIALQKIRACPRVCSRMDGQKIREAIRFCLDWICNNRNDEKYKSLSSLGGTDGVKGCGWGDNDTEVSSTIRTALAVTVLNRELQYQKQETVPAGAEVSSQEIARYEEAAQKGLQWLLDVQNSDGGWGNLDKRCMNRAYQTNHNFSYSDLEYQCASNAASTGYVMVALKEASANSYERQLRQAAEYLHNTQKPNGGWKMFLEIGIREGQRYTFRHFSTAWAIQGLIISGTAEYNDECVIDGFSYLTTLQDANYGGWKSSSNADNYTWATCNALDTIRLLKDSLSAVKAQEFLKIVCQWWEMKKEKANFSIKLGKRFFAFNAETCFAFCITFSLMVTLVLYLMYDLVTPLLVSQGEMLSKMIYSCMTIGAAVVLGLPWIVYVKNAFSKQVGSWIDAIGWVYGIITGFVLVLYQFIL